MPWSPNTARERSNLRLPAEWGSTSLARIPWLQYSKLQTNYLRAKSEWLERNAVARKDDLSMIWSGDGRNPNAALTVFRHFDSATVVKGLVGDQPKTAWSWLSAVRADLLPARGGLRRLATPGTS
jgi:hypothetical protein